MNEQKSYQFFYDHVAGLLVSSPLCPEQGVRISTTGEGNQKGGISTSLLQKRGTNTSGQVNTHPTARTLQYNDTCSKLGALDVCTSRYNTFIDTAVVYFSVLYNCREDTAVHVY